MPLMHFFFGFLGLGFGFAAALAEASAASVPASAASAESSAAASASVFGQRLGGGSRVVGQRDRLRRLGGDGLSAADHLHLESATVDAVLDIAVDQRGITFVGRGLLRAQFAAAHQIVGLGAHRRPLRIGRSGARLGGAGRQADGRRDGQQNRREKRHRKGSNNPRPFPHAKFPRVSFIHRLGAIGAGQ
jgi:hypothetical protein